MASRRFFAYDPYDYYYAAPYHYPYPYYQYQHPTPSHGHGIGEFFTDAAAPEAVSVAPRPRVESSRPVSIPVHFVGSDPEPERGSARMPRRRRAPSAEEAAVRVQAVARGFLARRSVRAVRDVEREAEEVGEKIAREAEALRGDARARIAVGEALMRLLLRLDAVRGAREYRRKVTKRVLALQDAVDALEAKSAPAAVTVDEDKSEVTAEMADDDGAAASQLPNAVEDHKGEIETMAVAEDRADGEPEEVEEAEEAQDGASLDGHKPEGSDVEGDWEMVVEEGEPEASTEPPASRPEAPRPQDPAGSDLRRAAEASAGAGDGDLDARKVMEMVAALCERNAQQCAVIGALAERVDALERAVRRAEEAERRRRRGKKAKKEGKGSNHSKCCSDCPIEGEGSEH
ncbi:hypothetical protein HU200_021506 [Digitaria exilis]|uniref:BAG domain-containing protein n=1 Tax=Digitaria exilis TaxID=1010633 RepID=A0A835EZ66_9POAL|nr:hypothetical protein HU200_021506 [Digitaria exilis]CAB3467588.1 unnamed protein product [Digitaria exilis]